MQAIDLLSRAGNTMPANVSLSYLHVVPSVLTQAAVEKTLPLLRAGWKLDREATPPANPDWQAFRSAREAWEERDRYIESLKNEFVISHLWVRYNDSTRRFNPLERMSRVK